MRVRRWLSGPTAGLRAAVLAAAVSAGIAALAVVHGDAGTWPWALTAAILVEFFLGRWYDWSRELREIHTRLAASNAAYPRIDTVSTCRIRVENLPTGGVALCLRPAAAVFIASDSPAGAPWRGVCPEHFGGVAAAGYVIRPSGMEGYPLTPERTTSD